MPRSTSALSALIADRDSCRDRGPGFEPETFLAACRSNVLDHSAKAALPDLNGAHVPVAFPAAQPGLAGWLAGLCLTAQPSQPRRPSQPSPQLGCMAAWAGSLGCPAAASLCYQPKTDQEITQFTTNVTFGTFLAGWTACLSGQPGFPAGQPGLAGLSQPSQPRLPSRQASQPSQPVCQPSQPSRQAASWTARG